MLIHVPNADHAAFVGLALQALKVTFDALADLYERKDGPWVDELRDATINEGGAPLITEARQVIEIFDALRKDLAPNDHWKKPERL